MKMESSSGAKMSGNSYLNEMLDMSSDGNAPKSEIIEFYKGLNIFITGGSGFLGKLLIEKLLRACPKIGKIYLLLRKKKDKLPEERLKEQFDNEIYSLLKKENPNFMKHVVMIEGDTAEPDLGLSPENKRILLENTDIVFHGAATTRFDSPLRTAVEINVRGTKKVLTLAKEMKNLKAFIHISTAFSQCYTTYLEERFYDLPVDVEKLFSLIDLFDDETLERLTIPFIDKWPNTYSFSKACAEQVVRQHAKDMPICLARPSIVTSTYREPLEGWNSSIYGPTGLMMAGYVCILRTEYCDGNAEAELIPADYVINNLIAVAWDLGKKWKSEIFNELDVINNNNISPQKNEKDPTVYNIVSSTQNPISWQKFFDRSRYWGIKNPCNLHMWYATLTLTSNKLLYDILFFLLHTTYGFVLDKLLILSGKKPMLSDVYKKIYKFGMAYAFFKNQRWKFVDDNVVDLWKKMNATDQDKFVFNAINMNWDEYSRVHIVGIRNYILKRPEDKSIFNYVKYGIYVVLHYSLVAAFFYSLGWILYKTFMMLFSFVLFQMTAQPCVTTS